MSNETPAETVAEWIGYLMGIAIGVSSLVMLLGLFVLGAIWSWQSVCGLLF